MDQRSKIAILGFGVEGKAMLKYLLDNGYPDLTVCDQNVDLKDEMPDGVSVRLGEDYLQNLDEFDAVIRSPGIKYYDPNVQFALQNGVEVTSVTGFFMDQCPCKVIGVTGTKGKGTTCTLIYEMLKKAGEDVYLGGNIGVPPVEFLDDLKGDSIAVLELSSFQLQDLLKSPYYAVLLNTTKDHLDYHVDTGEYLQAKEALLKNQNKNSVAVLNRDYEYSDYYIPLVKGNLKLVSVRQKVHDGAYVDDEMIYYAKDGKIQKVADVDEVALIGAHNLENIMPAVVIARELGVKIDDIADVIREFSGLPHRLEFVRELKEVKFYDDSFSTTAETSMAAVESFDEPTVLIAGGSDKGLSYDDWALKILTRPNLHTVILIGETAEEMENAIVEAEEKLKDAEGSPTRVLRRQDLEEAVLEAFAQSDEGGVVVMSPAAASFDMFENYKDRGEKFKSAVKKLK